MRSGCLLAGFTERNLNAFAQTGRAETGSTNRRAPFSCARGSGVGKET